MQYACTFQSPIGVIRLQATETDLCALSFDDASIDAERMNPILEKATVQLSEYFAGSLTSFQLPLQQEGSPFRQKIWQMLAAIPYGTTSSYHALSKAYGDVKAIRAIASANAKNCLAIIVPCHRVVGSDGGLTGFAWGLERKRWLLEHEAKWSGRGLQTGLF